MEAFRAGGRARAAGDLTQFLHGLESFLRHAGAPSVLRFAVLQERRRPSVVPALQFQIVMTGATYHRDFTTLFAELVMRTVAVSISAAAIAVGVILLTAPQ